MQVSVIVTFEAGSRAEAEKLIGSWKLHDGVQVQGSTMETLDRLSADAKGKLAAVIDPPIPEPNTAPAADE